MGRWGVWRGVEGREMSIGSETGESVSRTVGLARGLEKEGDLLEEDGVRVGS
jgi:hypothetical protein